MLKCCGQPPIVGAADSCATQTVTSFLLEGYKLSRASVEGRVYLHLQHCGITCARGPTPMAEYQSGGQAQLTIAGRFGGLGECSKTEQQRLVKEITLLESFKSFFFFFFLWIKVHNI